MPHQSMINIESSSYRYPRSNIQSPLAVCHGTAAIYYLLSTIYYLLSTVYCLQSTRSILLSAEGRGGQPVLAEPPDGLPPALLELHHGGVLQVGAGILDVKISVNDQHRDRKGI